MAKKETARVQDELRRKAAEWRAKLATAMRTLKAAPLGGTAEETAARLAHLRDNPPSIPLGEDLDDYATLASRPCKTQPRGSGRAAPRPFAGASLRMGPLPAMGVARPLERAAPHGRRSGRATKRLLALRCGCAAGECGGGAAASGAGGRGQGGGGHREWRCVQRRRAPARPRHGHAEGAAARARGGREADGGGAAGATARQKLEGPEATRRMSLACACIGAGAWRGAPSARGAVVRGGAERVMCRGRASLSSMTPPRSGRRWRTR